MTKVLAFLSGGIDSSVSCYILKEMGFDVTAVTMKTWDGKMEISLRSNSCYGPHEDEDIEVAKRVTERLKIPHIVVDLSKDYRDLILREFFDEYLRGRTPNPCVKCNSRIKFGVLLEKVKEMGIEFERVATGHYAKIIYDEKKSRYMLARGNDKKKDQSYFLYRLTQEQLGITVFPLADRTKEDVKKLAENIGLGFLLQKKESQDFLPCDYSEVFRDFQKPGYILDPSGRVIGVHEGICNYTVGQRRGLNLRGLKEPYYVLKIDAERNEIVAGPRRMLSSSALYASDLNWIIPYEEVKDKILYAQVRYRSAPSPSRIQLFGEKLRVEFLEPQEAITPGQSVVLYDGDTVVGGGIIDQAESPLGLDVESLRCHRST